MTRCIPYNRFIDWDRGVIADGTLEPVSLSEAKRHLNLQFDQEGSYEFNDDDIEIEELIPVARTAMENYTGRSLIRKTITAIIQNEKGGIELPYGPIIDLTSLKDEDDEDITSGNYKLQGLEFKTLKYPCKSYMTAVYTAGYTPENIPADLKKAILHQLAFLYTRRGDQDKEYAASEIAYSPSAKNLAAPYRRTTWLL